MLSQRLKIKLEISKIIICYKCSYLIIIFYYTENSKRFINMGCGESKSDKRSGAGNGDKSGALERSLGLHLLSIEDFQKILKEAAGDR